MPEQAAFDPSLSLRWFQTGTDPEKWDLAEKPYPENEGMAIGSVGHVTADTSGGWTWETYPDLHQYGTAPLRASAMRDLEAALPPRVGRD